MPGATSTSARHGRTDMWCFLLAVVLGFAGPASPTVFDKPILFDKFLFHPCRWMMFAPCLPLVGNELPLFVKPVGVFKCAVVELHRHSEARNRVKP